MKLREFITIDKNNEIYNNGWVEWLHLLVPPAPDWLRDICRMILAVLGHCLICTSLSGCYFKRTNMPRNPIHVNCDCLIFEIKPEVAKEQINAQCDIRKFTEYVFADGDKSKGKKEIFNKLGYDINNADVLRDEMCRQAMANYANGIYTLSMLDDYGQRLAIPIELNGTYFYSGWLVCPGGLIKNTTPFGGWVR